MLEAAKQLGRQDGLALDPVNASTNDVQPGRAQREVEGVGVVFDVVEVVREIRLAEHGVDMLHRAERGAGEGFVLDEEKAAALFAEEPFLERVEGETDQPVAGRDPVDPGVDGVARLEAEHAGQLEGVLADEALDRVHDPGDAAHAADHPRVGKQLCQRGQLGAPDAVGVEDYPVGLDRPVIVGEQAAQDVAALGVVDEDRGLVAPAHRRFERHVHRAHGTCHRRVEARDLAQDRRQQRRSGTRQAGDEVHAVSHVKDPESG